MQELEEIRAPATGEQLGAHRDTLAVQGKDVHVCDFPEGESFEAKCRNGVCVLLGQSWDGSCSLILIGQGMSFVKAKRLQLNHAHVREVKAAVVVVLA